MEKLGEEKWKLLITGPYIRVTVTTAEYRVHMIRSCDFIKTLSLIMYILVYRIHNVLHIGIH